MNCYEVRVVYVYPEEAKGKENFTLIEIAHVNGNHYQLVRAKKKSVYCRLEVCRCRSKRGAESPKECKMCMLTSQK